MRTGWTTYVYEPVLREEGVENSCVLDVILFIFVHMLVFVFSFYFVHVFFLFFLIKQKI